MNKILDILGLCLFIFCPVCVPGSIDFAFYFFWYCIFKLSPLIIKCLFLIVRCYFYNSNLLFSIVYLFDGSFINILCVITIFDLFLFLITIFYCLSILVLFNRSRISFLLSLFSLPLSNVDILVLAVCWVLRVDLYSILEELFISINFNLYSMSILMLHIHSLPFLTTYLVSILVDFESQHLHSIQYSLSVYVKTTLLSLRAVETLFPVQQQWSTSWRWAHPIHFLSKSHSQLVKLNHSIKCLSQLIAYSYIWFCISSLFVSKDNLS